MGSVRTFRDVHAVPSDIQKHLYIIWMKSPSCPFLDDIMSVPGGGTVWYQLTFPFSLSFLFFLPKTYSLILLIIGIST
jgi:hypothetical protein